MNPDPNEPAGAAGPAASSGDPDPLDDTQPVEVPRYAPAPDPRPDTRWAWAPADRYTQDGVVHPQDQRSLARRAVADLAAAGFTARAPPRPTW